jgi:hypothetical protein
MRSSTAAELFVCAALLAAAPAAGAQDEFPHDLPLSAQLSEGAPLETDYVFSERARERNLLSVIASADAVIDTFSARVLLDGISAGVAFSDLLELMACARHIASWELPAATHGITGGFQLAARVPLDLQARWWFRLGFELGFSPGGPVSFVGRLHLQARMRLGSSVWMGVSLLNPVMRNHESRVATERGLRWGLMSGVELLVTL